jgi:hypothetical protein
MPKFQVGDRVHKDSGDYTFEGEVVAAFAKKSGTVRYVVEDDRGLLFIFNESSLKLFNESSVKLVENWEDDAAALNFLIGRDFTVKRSGRITCPFDRQLTTNEKSAIDYLWLEWDYAFQKI